jgi:hypothetical protein
MLSFILVVAAFLLVMTGLLHRWRSSPGSRSGALTGGLLDSVAMVCLLLGVFGVLMVLVLGVLPESGLRITGRSLPDLVLASLGLVAAGLGGLSSGALWRGLRGRRRRAAAPAAH